MTKQPLLELNKNLRNELYDAMDIIDLMLDIIRRQAATIDILKGKIAALELEREDK